MKFNSLLVQLTSEN